MAKIKKKGYLSIGLHSGAGWKYPSAQMIHGIQANRSLSYQMLKDVEVKEIIAGKSSPEEILEIRRWMEYHQASNQSILPTKTVSMNLKEVRVTHYDWIKMIGELLMSTRSKSLKTYLAKERISGFNDNKWKQLPALIMIGNGTSSLPVCVGLGVKVTFTKLSSFILRYLESTWRWQVS